MKALIAISTLGLLLLAAPQSFAQETTTPTASSLSDLLQKVRAGWKAEKKENKAREARFVAEKRNQANLLKEAEAELAREEDRSTRLEATFAENEEELARQEERLADELGSLGELFGVVRQVAGDTLSTVENSLVSAEVSDRKPFLDALGQNTALPAIEDLEKLWFTLQQEMTESGTVTRFSTQIIDSNGTQREAEVVRVGPFIAVSDGEYLKWESELGQLQALPRQPPERYLKTLRSLDDTAEGLVRVAIDPARGTLLNALIQSRTARERIEDGGVIGYVIIALGLVTAALAFVRFFYVFFIGRLVKRQVKDAGNPSEKNPLGRVLSVFNENAAADTEALELKLDEVILRETSSIERYLWAIKVVAAIAPLMGLLGTVTGMIQTFQAITLFGTGDPKLMADGISVALVTTMLGLCVAIPLVLLHSMIGSMTKGVTDVIEEQSAGLVARRAEGLDS